MRLGRTRARLERDALAALLAACGGLRRAAQSAGVSARLLRHHLRRHGLAAPPRRRGPR